VSVIVDGVSYLVVADHNNNAIRLLNTTAQAVSTLAGGSLGYEDGVRFGAKFRQPKGIAVAVNGSSVFVADSGNNLIRSVAVPSGENRCALCRVPVVSCCYCSCDCVLGTGVVSTAVSVGASPVSIAVVNSSSGDTLYITTTVFRVMSASVASVVVTATPFCGAGVSGNVDGHCSVARFGALGDIVSSLGTLYVVDTSAALIRVIDIGTQVVSTLATIGDTIFQPQSLLTAANGAYLVVGEGRTTGSGVIIVTLADSEYRTICQ
jgi:DNA-binding beta-propeller fold protein YncE